MTAHPQVPIEWPEPTPTDHARMAKQRKAVFNLMALGAWLTLREIAELTGHPEASISARLRDLRKSAYGGHTVERRRRHGPETATWEYRLTEAAR